MISEAKNLENSLTEHIIFPHDSQQLYVHVMSSEKKWSWFLQAQAYR